MKRVFLTLMCLMVPALAHADVYVICNNSLSVDAGEVAAIFSGDKQVAGGTKLAPVDNKATQAEFLDKALHTDTVKYSAGWAKKAFRDGLSAPKVKANDAEVIEFVKSNPGGIGYVGSQAAGVKTVTKY